MTRLDEARAIAAQVWPDLSASDDPVRSLASFMMGVHDGALDGAAARCDELGATVASAQIRAMKVGRPWS